MMSSSNKSGNLGAGDMSSVPDIEFIAFDGRSERPLTTTDYAAAKGHATSGDPGGYIQQVTRTLVWRDNSQASTL